MRGWLKGYSSKHRDLHGVAGAFLFTIRLWEIGDIVALVEAGEAKIDRRRGSYKKKLLES